MISDIDIIFNAAIIALIFNFTITSIHSIKFVIFNIVMIYLI
jgi:hypothetical protein